MKRKSVIFAGHTHLAMKNRMIIFLVVFVATVQAAAGATAPPKTNGKGYFDVRSEVVNGDTVQVYDMPTIPVFARKADMRKYEKLVRNVKKVYPIALAAQKRLAEMEEKILQIPKKGRQREYIKKAEKELMKEYTPVLKTMTFSQGKILIKLIDRQTDKTSYDIVKELRGGFRAAFWQGIAKLFDANLKEGYDKDGEDKMIEQIILMYEAGLI